MKKKPEILEPRDILNSIVRIIARETNLIETTGEGTLNQTTATNLTKYSSALTDILKTGQKVDDEAKKLLSEMSVEELEKKLDEAP